MGNRFYSKWNYREVLGFKSKRISDEINNSDYPVDIISSFDNIFIETDIALGMIINGKRTVVLYIILQWM